MKIVVFGAAGWLGRAILSASVNRAEVRAFDLGPGAWQEWRDLDGDWTGGEIVHGDISDFSTVARAADGMDAVIHTAVFYPRAFRNWSTTSRAVSTSSAGLKGPWRASRSS